MSCKRGALRNFTKFTRKYLCRLATLLKKRPWQRDPVKFAEFLRSFSYRTSPVAPSESSCMYALSVCSVFVLSRSPRILWQKHTSEYLFYRTAPSGCFQMSVIFLKKREKQKQFFMPPLTLKRFKTCNGIKIKILFIHDSEKKPTRIYLPIFSI